MTATPPSTVVEDPADSEALRPAARRYLIGVILTALGTAVVALSRTSAPDPEQFVLAVALTAAVTLAQLFPLHIAAKTKLYLDTAVLVAVVVLFDPGVALLVMGVGTVLGHVARRQPWDQTLFNTAQVILLAAWSSLLLTALGWRGNQAALDQPQWILLIAAVGVAMILVSAFLASTMVALQLGEPLLRTWRQAVVPDDWSEGLTHLAQVGLGILVAGLAYTHSWMVALLILPAGSAYQALAHHIRLRRQAEARLVHQAYHDPLTDLPNRARMLDRLEQALARAGR